MLNKTLRHTKNVSIRILKYDSYQTTLIVLLIAVYDKKKSWKASIANEIKFKANKNK